MESLFDACLQDSQLVTYNGITFGLRIIDRSFAYFRVSLLESLKRHRTGGEVRFLRLTAVKVRSTRYS